MDFFECAYRYCTIEPHKSEQEWLQERHKSIGASESAAIIGLSKFSSPLGVWVRKTRGAEPGADVDPDLSGVGMVEWGHRHEPAIAQKFSEETGYTTQDLGDYTILRSLPRPWMTCTPDRITSSPDGDPGMLEIKCAWYDAAREWSERVPIAYQVQMQHTLYVTGLSVGYFAVLLNGYDFRYYRVERNQRYIHRLCTRVDAFWHKVKTGEQPAADASADSTRILRVLYPDEVPGKSMDLPKDMDEVIDGFDRAKAAEKAAKEQANGFGNLIRQEMGDAEVAVSASHGGFSWKQSGKSRRFLRKKNMKGEDYGV